jgi:para-aminobenzoate synthetase component I
MNQPRFLSISFPSLKHELIALGRENEFVFGNNLAEIDTFIAENQGKYIFMCLSYDLKNRIENLSSSNEDYIDFPEILIWTAQAVVEVIGMDYQLIEGEMNEDFSSILSSYLDEKTIEKVPKINFESQISRNEYIKNVQEIKHEIQLGNCYELNYCQQFYAENVGNLPSFEIFKRLKKLTKAPFSSYLNTENHEVFCGSPERYLQKIGNKIISQPIKGTSKRGKNPEEDEELKANLFNDPKERSENVMITDLVRNDLSRIASKNSVQVEELCGIYTFGTVHQMISTISCDLKEGESFSDILKATFPMGSMTGAPKIPAMNLIEKHEVFKRGLFSGSIGYISPNGDFDLNVIIRSLIYNKDKKILSASVGGAITINSNEENEYEECQVKIKKIVDLFDGN